MGHPALPIPMQDARYRILDTLRTSHPDTGYPMQHPPLMLDAGYWIPRPAQPNTLNFKKVSMAWTCRPVTILIFRPVP